MTRLCLFVVGLLLLVSLTGCGGSSSSEKWEYFIAGDIKNGFGETVGTSTDALNKAGAEGWEAVGVFPNAAVLMKRRASASSAAPAPVVVTP